VVRSWTSWGSEHKFIWTRYEIGVDSIIKGTQERTVILSEPGGILNGLGMHVEGAVAYTPGEQVTVFLRRYPSGDKRTVGWGQGKFAQDAGGRLHPVMGGSVVAIGPAASASTAISSLDGITSTELRQRILKATQGRKLQ
jgi:hypothetical protein